MKSCVKKIIFLILLSSLVFSLSALELKQGRIKLVLHENTGRFSAYYLNDVTRNRYVSFFFDDDPRTTVLSVLVDNQLYRMGESFEFTQTVEKTASGAAFFWKSGFLEIREEFSFITSGNSGLSDGFSVTVSIKNTSESSLNVGVRFLADTYLGESDNTHFSTPSRTSIQNETDFTGSYPDFWVSSPKSREGVALQCTLKAPGVTLPDRILMGNWKRLNDSSWNFDSRSSRNFNLLPYSVNDSAVCHYYNPIQIPRSGERKIVMVFGQYSTAGYSLTERLQEDISELYTKTVVPEVSSADPLEAAKTDLLTIKDLLFRIDTLITSGKDIPQEQIDTLMQIVMSLENRKNQHKEQK